MISEKKCFNILMGIQKERPSLKVKVNLDLWYGSIVIVSLV